MCSRTQRRQLAQMCNSIQILTAYKWDNTKYIVRSNLDIASWNGIVQIWPNDLFLRSHKFRQLIFVLYHDITCICFRQQDGKNYPMAQITEIMIWFLIFLLYMLVQRGQRRQLAQMFNIYLLRTLGVVLNG